jgi:hypothetical protein
MMFKFKLPVTQRGLRVAERPPEPAARRPGGPAAASPGPAGGPSRAGPGSARPGALSPGRQPASARESESGGACGRGPWFICVT